MRDISDWYDDELDSDSDDYPIDHHNLNFGGNEFNIATLFSFVEVGQFVIPAFQRNYVWDQKAASKLIESLIIGLPIPQLFLYKDKDGKLLVIDGQQRLLTTYFFKKQRFPRKERRADIREIFDKHGKIPDDILHDNKFFTEFTLQLRTPNPQKKNRLHGLKYSTLGEDQSNFDLCTLRTVTISQQGDSEDDSSVYEIFNRLNTGGMNLKPQEIRTSLYHSAFYSALASINKNPVWRKLLGLAEPDLHMKDVEFLLRSFAMLLTNKNYSSSMMRFLNTFSRTAKTLKADRVEYLIKLMENFLEACSELRADSFRGKSGRFSASIFESVFVATCEPLLEKKQTMPSRIEQSLLDSLRSDSTFLAATEKRTADKKNVDIRLSRAKSIFYGTPG